MTPSELKRLYKTHNPNGHFFNTDTMKFFGDSMKNFGVITKGDLIVLYRKKNTRKGFPAGSKWYFNKTNGALI
jgi:hypothetical protein